jgi:hypothetical protein
MFYHFHFASRCSSFTASSTSLPYEMTSLENEGEPFTFLIVFDFESYKEPKNPVAAIRAFLEALPASIDPSGKY